MDDAVEVVALPTEHRMEAVTGQRLPRRFVRYLGVRVMRADRMQAQVDEDQRVRDARKHRSEEHTSELQSLMRISYAVFCLKKKTPPNTSTTEVQAKYVPSHTDRLLNCRHITNSATVN